MDVTTGKAEYQAPALEKGLAILEYLAEQFEPHTVPQIAKAVGRSRNEIYRMLVVLERRSYLERTADDRYRLSNRLFDLGMRSPPLRNLHDAALPLMHILAEQLLQSCHLVVASGSDMVVVARVESPAQLGFAVRVGYRRPITQSTSGRILFGFLGEERRSRWLARLSQEAAPDEISSFVADADKARQTGFFAGPSPIVDGVTDVGAPVLGGDGDVAASLTLPYVSGRFARTTLHDAIDVLRSTAGAIGHKLTNG